MGLADDPTFNVIEMGIKEDIEVALAHGRLRAAMMLIYAGTDAMAFLDMPAGQTDVTRADFVRWAERYIRLPCWEQLTGEDMYGARCALLHTYGVSSKLSRAGKCRQVGYMDKSVPEIRYDPKVSTDLVLVSVAALKQAFFDGINRFLVHCYTNDQKKAVVEARFQQMICMFPLGRSAE